MSVEQEPNVEIVDCECGSNPICGLCGGSGHYMVALRDIKANENFIFKRLDKRTPLEFLVVDNVIDGTQCKVCKSEIPSPSVIYPNGDKIYFCGVCGLEQ